MEDKDKPQPTSLFAKLRHIQLNLNAPKDLENKFGGYKYRSCESILKAVKPLLAETETTLVIQDRIVQIGDRFYVEATARLYGEGSEKIASDDYIASVGYAREDLAKKGMDGAQLTGATSSYARKYALNALFAIDDSRDSDMTNKHKTDNESIIADALLEILSATKSSQVREIYNKYLALESSICGKTGKLYKAVVERGKELKAIENT